MNWKLILQLSRHAREGARMRTMRLPDSPRLMMVLTGPVIGLIPGIALGIFAVVAARFVAPGAAVAPPAGSRTA